MWFVIAPGSVVSVGYAGRWPDILRLLTHLSPQASPEVVIYQSLADFESTNTFRVLACKGAATLFSGF